MKTFDPPLDPGIEAAVLVLRDAGVETFESCEGGPGHAYPEPTVRFHGDAQTGYEALAAAQRAGLPVATLRRAWPVLDREPTGPYWELTFTPAKTGDSPHQTFYASLYNLLLKVADTGMARGIRYCRYRQYHNRSSAKAAQLVQLSSREVVKEALHRPEVKRTREEE